VHALPVDRMVVSVPGSLDARLYLDPSSAAAVGTRLLLLRPPIA
jgi:hypothetical protein